MPTWINDQRFLYKIAKAYYLDGMTQQAIANRFKISRPKVSRLLQQAKEEKIVTITLVPPSGNQSDLESELERMYALDEVIVVNTSDDHDPLTITREIGPSAAEVLLRSLKGDEIIALAWGRSILSMVEAMPIQSLHDVTIVQMIGGLGSASSDEHSAELVRRAARKLNADFRLLSAPGIVANHSAVKALKSDAQIAETLDMAAGAEIAVVGLGVLSPDSVLLKGGNILNKKDLETLQNAGAVGDVILRFLDKQGNPLNLDVNQRIIGLSLNQLKKIPRVIAVAGGENKFHIIQAALKAGIINVLVTDISNAKRLLNETKPREK